VLLKGHKSAFNCYP